MPGWSIPNTVRQNRAAERREYVTRIVQGGVPKKVACYYAGVSRRTLNRYLKDARETLRAN